MTSRSWAAAIGVLKGMVRRSPIAGPAQSLYRRLRPPSAAALNTRSDVETEEVMTRVLSSDSNSVDVGARTGSILRVILRYAGRGHHIAFGAGHDRSA